MSCLQASAVKNYPCIRKHQGSSDSGSRSRQCRVTIQTLRSFASSSLQLSAKEVICHQASKLPVHKYRRLVPVGSFGGGQAKSNGDGEGSGQKSVEAPIGSFRKEPSLEDLLRKQMEKQGYFDGDDGGDASGRPPRGGGGGGGGGGGNSPAGGGSDEVLQVFLATSALLMLYIYIINGEELRKLAQDYMKYLRTGKKSNRLRGALYQWRRFFRSARDKTEDPSEWLPHQILTTKTWFDSLDKYKYMADPEGYKKARKKERKKMKEEGREVEEDYPFVPEEKEEKESGEEEEDYYYGEEEDEQEKEEEDEEQVVEKKASPYGDDDKDEEEDDF